jgi:CRP-like cAMP-binding protein
MVSSLELRHIAAFSNLPDDQIGWFLSHAQEVGVQAGEVFVRQGEPADWMVIFLDGLFQWRGEFGGDTVALPAQAGDISGAFPFSRMKRFTVTGRALTDGRILKFPAVLFPELIQKNAGTDGDTRRHDVRQNTRRDSNRAAARPTGLVGETFGRTCA